MELSGWGQFPVHDVEVVAPRNEGDLLKAIASGRAIARGNGRSYGDSALSKANTIDMCHFNKMIGFDDEKGIVVAEAGVRLDSIIDAFLPRGWFPAVTPGTKFVTLGGMIASDVHGKNHHRDGSVGNFIEWIDLIDANREVKRCSRHKNKELFEWTIGGMGLTGVILRAAMRLTKVETAWIHQETIPARNLEHAIDIFESSHDATYSVAWIDCLSKGEAKGRSLVMLGEHATLDRLQPQHKRRPLEIPKKKAKTVYIHFPSYLLNNLTVKAFNALYYWNGRRTKGKSFVDWDTYFYPLDAILGWNKIYGRKGFMQFQCVLPVETSRDGLSELLDAIEKSGAGSFLAVLKRFGHQTSKFSFPMDGYTLALDFPVNRKTIALMEQLDKITLKYDGRFYLAKDSRMNAETLRSSDDRVAAFKTMRQENSPNSEFQSEQSRRLKI